MKSYLILISISTLISCSTGSSFIVSEYNYSREKPVEGQIYTAERLRKYMDEKNYEIAISLFSLEQQKNINAIKENEEIFKYWCDAWTFDSAKFEWYISKIKNQEAPFIFENGEWKIDER